MRRLMQPLLVGCVVIGCGYSQTIQVTASPAELGYLNFMLLNLSHLTTATSIHKYEQHLASQFGLSAVEIAVIDEAGNSLRPTVSQIHSLTRKASAARTDSETGALTSLTAQRDLMVPSLVNHILSSVRSLTATRLRTPGHVVAALPNTTGYQRVNVEEAQ